MVLKLIIYYQRLSTFESINKIVIKNSGDDPVISPIYYVKNNCIIILLISTKKPKVLILLPAVKG
jgi:hypothetical protein